MVEPTALAALAIDAVIGWPQGLYQRVGHPVTLFARVIEAAERHWNRPTLKAFTRRAAGVFLVLLLASATFLLALAVEQALWAWLGRWGWTGVAIAAAPGLAQRSLYLHVRPVADRLAAGDIENARGAVGMIVGRDTAHLDEPGIARGAIESLAESFCDGVVAPLLFLLLLGLPGIWAYKAINTADSLIGHKEDRWRAFGWAAARTDDVLNLFPARLAAILLCVAGQGGWRILWRDHAQHASPNSGWPEAAMAGALRLRLAGPISYDGIVHAKPWIGDGRTDANAADIRRALALYGRACLLLWVLAGGFIWAL